MTTPSCRGQVISPPAGTGGAPQHQPIWSASHQPIRSGKPRGNSFHLREEDTPHHQPLVKLRRRQPFGVLFEDHFTLDMLVKMGGIGHCRLLFSEPWLDPAQCLLLLKTKSGRGQPGLAFSDTHRSAESPHKLSALLLCQILCLCKIRRQAVVGQSATISQPMTTDQLGLLTPAPRYPARCRRPALGRADASRPSRRPRRSSGRWCLAVDGYAVQRTR